MSKPSLAAREVASFIKGYTRGTTLGVHLQQYPDGEAHIAEAIQSIVDEGYMIGIVVTGDHEDKDGKTVLDWNRLEPSDE
jgi:hypothetical protein